MHAKNPFSADYDFENLVKHEPSLKDFVLVNEHGTQTIKFSNKDAVKALNRAILKAQYDIKWEIPEKNLCPPIPGRLDYLLHAAELLEKTDIRLLDIGTGANLIYPILATCHLQWKCVGSELDEESLKNAEEIIANNPQLKDIELRTQISKYKIFENIIQPEEEFDIVVCNPPFFKSSLEAKEKNARKVKNLKLEEEETKNFGGISNELWCIGGEEEFVKRMVAESVEYKSQVHWFTSLVSQKDNLKNIKRAINKTFPTEMKVINMEQGNKISRFIAWTYR